MCIKWEKGSLFVVYIKVTDNFDLIHKVDGKKDFLLYGVLFVKNI